jgi:hypothetical protein
MRAPHRPAIVAGLVLASIALASGPTLAGRPGGGGGGGPVVLSFDGYPWLVKSSTRKIGPGPNLFATANAWVAADGLHLRISKVSGKWNAAEVINQASLGRGTYSWTVAGDLNALDRNAVLGLFTWNDDPTDNHREIDVEFSRWSNASDPTNGQFVVQPYSTSGNLLRITQPAGEGSSTHAFTWGTSSVAFASSAAAPSSWTYTGPDVPHPGGENARMNLWLFRGAAPSNGQPIEVVITDFTFTPLP